MGLNISVVIRDIRACELLGLAYFTEYNCFRLGPVTNVELHPFFFHICVVINEVETPQFTNSSFDRHQSYFFVFTIVECAVIELKVAFSYVDFTLFGYFPGVGWLYHTVFSIFSCLSTLPTDFIMSVLVYTPPNNVVGYLLP